jgi:putative glutamine amidotransferase
MRAPVIGITLDSEEPGGYSKFPWYAVRQNYCQAVSDAGGVAIVLPHDVAHIPAYLAMTDGLIVTGGHFDIDPAHFGAAARHPTVKLKSARTDFEFAITRACLTHDFPVLGICGGEQLLNVVLGGSLIQHIPDEVPNALEHEQKAPRDQPGHAVQIADGTKLRSIIGTAELAVNSAHHQAVKSLGPNVAANAFAPDGVIEGIEATDRRFCIGVQWHPEFQMNDGDRRLFAALIAAARS